jgi:hypothetical protein
MAPTGACVIVPMPGGIARVYVSARRETTGRPEPTPAAIQALVDLHGPGGISLGEPRWASVFRAQSRLARRWHVGRAVLAGDAAHIQSPAGGQGMNVAIRDAHNLGWRLAAALRGADAEALLDRYERERRRVAAGVLRETDQQMRVLAFASRPARALRDGAFRQLDRRGLMASRLPATAGLKDAYGRRRTGARLPDVAVRDASTGAELAVHALMRDPRFSLFVRDDAAAAPLLPRVVARFGAQLAVRVVSRGPGEVVRWADSHLIDASDRVLPRGCEALLVRPDGHIAASLGRATDARLEVHLERALPADGARAAVLTPAGGMP